MAKMSEEMKTLVSETKARYTNVSKCMACPKHCQKCDDIHDAEVTLSKEKHIRDCVSPHLATHTLCWCCEKGITGGCNWIDKRLPVEHWDADPTNRGEYTSYHVNDCPEFVRG